VIGSRSAVTGPNPVRDQRPVRGRTVRSLRLRGSVVTGASLGAPDAIVQQPPGWSRGPRATRCHPGV